MVQNQVNVNSFREYTNNKSLFFSKFIFIICLWLYFPLGDPLSGFAKTRYLKKVGGY